MDDLGAACGYDGSVHLTLDPTVKFAAAFDVSEAGQRHPSHAMTTGAECRLGADYETWGGRGLSYRSQPAKSSLTRSRPSGAAGT